MAMLQAVGESLVSIFGQHEHRVLLDPEEHIDILDKFGAAGDLRASTAEAFGTWKKTAKELAAAEAKLKEIQQLALQNAKDIEELTNACLKPGEEEELIQEREVLKRPLKFVSGLIRLIKHFIPGPAVLSRNWGKLEKPLSIWLQ